MKYRIGKNITGPYRLLMMLLTLILTLSGLTACGVSGEMSAGQMNENGKPSIPLSLEIVPDSAPTPGGLVGFEVTARSMVALENLVVTVNLPGITLVEGTVESRGPVQADEPRSLRFTIRVPEQGRHAITATATTDHLGARFAVRRQYLLGEPEPDANGKPQPRRTDGVIEYELP